MKQWKNSAMLLAAAFIWGCAFVAQSVGMDYVSPFVFNGIRSVLGAIVLLPVIRLMDHLHEKNGESQAPKTKAQKKQTWLIGIGCGILLCVASNLQQYGILYTSVGKAGFLTTIYVVLVPVFSVFAGKRPRFKMWISVLLALAGLYLLCMQPGSYSLEPGDIILLMSAAAFTFHILYIDRFGGLIDGVRMSAIQFLTCGILTLAAALIVGDSFAPGQIMAAWLPILYAGVMSCGGAYTLQILGQRDCSPVLATLLLSLESVFSVLAGWVILGERLSARELGGCAIVFAAVLLAELPILEGKNVKEQGREKEA